MEMLLVNIIHYIYVQHMHTFLLPLQDTKWYWSCTVYSVNFDLYILQGRILSQEEGEGLQFKGGGGDPATLPPPNLPLICPKFLFLFFIYNEILTLGYRINTHSHLKVIYTYLDLLMFRLNFQFQFQNSGSLTPGSDLLISCIYL